MSSEVPSLNLSMQEWDQNFTSTIVKFSIVTVIFIVILILLFTIGNLTEIAKNWSRYRCNPLFMPLASNFGYDINENFQFCLQSMFKTKAGEVFAPLYGLLHNFTGIVSQIVDTTLGLRKLFSNFLLGMNSFMRNVRDRVQGLLFQLRLTFIKMQTLMGRVYGTLYSIIWIGTSAATAGINLSENDLVKFIVNMCFDPTTEVRMNDGTIKELQYIHVGDVLESGIKVTSTFVIDGTKTPMVRYKGITLSTNHLVQTEDGWKEAGECVGAEAVPSLSRLICLNVDGHVFKTASGLIVADYDESESPTVIQEVQKMAEQSLNGGIFKPSVADYSLGLDTGCEVLMNDKTWQSIGSVAIGDILEGNNRVLGIVNERCNSLVQLDNSADMVVSSSQLVFSNNSWVRAGNIGHSFAKFPRTLKQFITDRVGPIACRKPGSNTIVWVRDYRESPIPEMEDPYLNDKK
jgi:hypothetical protein